MMAETLQISEIAWVLAGQVGVGAGCGLAWQPEDNLKLAGFSAKPYLSSLKGFLDPAGNFVLAACSLLKDAAADLVDDALLTGVSAMSQHGATVATSSFYRQLVQKGPRLASPMIFPHSYASTAPNLAAIEFGWAGPHTVYFGKQDCRETLEYAAARLAEGSTQNMVVVVYEAAMPEFLPAGRRVRNGALALLLQKPSECPARLRFSMGQLRGLPSFLSAEGSVQDMLCLLNALGA
jgi:hypothetical protein